MSAPRLEIRRAGGLMLLISLYVSHRFAGPIYRFEKSCQSLASGDLTHKKLMPALYAPAMKAQQSLLRDGFLVAAITVVLPLSTFVMEPDRFR